MEIIPGSFHPIAHLMINSVSSGCRRRLISLQRFLKANPLQPLTAVLLFVVLILSFHFLYILCANNGFYPFGTSVQQLFTVASHHLFLQSSYLLDITGIEYTTHDQTFYIANILGNTSWVEVSPTCTSLKQWLHWVFLMMLFPGPWRHKLWYIPLGLLIIQGISIIRITGLACAVYRWPGSFPFFHDYVFKGLFYGVIFLMWVIWVEFLQKKHR